MQENNSEMSLNDILQQFHNTIVDDPRVGPMHICLYSAILYVANQQGFKSPISIFSKDLMKYSKIAGVATYTRCIKELKELGFIDYIPSYNPLLGSLIFLLNPDHVV